MTSTKHAYFVVNETLQLYRDGGSPCWAASLDATKAFDRLWRSGLFYKLIDKIPDVIWRILFLYYKSSKGMIKQGNSISKAFAIEEGVKQGGIISPLLFNFFINDLLSQCLELNIGAKVGELNVCVIAYCDDLILLSPIKSHLRKLLSVCDEFAIKWKLQFNPLKSLIYCTDNNRLQESNFLIGGGNLKPVTDFEYLGLPIGNKTYINNFFEEKFRSVEKAFFTIRRVGIHKGFWFPNTLGFIYKQYCQSIFNYGLELISLSGSLLKQLDKRQSLILKMTLNLSKFSRSTPLLEALRVSSIEQLYFKHKFLFLSQLRKNWIPNTLFEYLKSIKRTRNKLSYISQLKCLNNVIGVNAETCESKQAFEKLSNKFSCGNLGLVHSVRTALGDPAGGSILRLLLRVEFGPSSGDAEPDKPPDTCAMMTDALWGGSTLLYGGVS